MTTPRALLLRAAAECERWAPRAAERMRVHVAEADMVAPDAIDAAEALDVVRGSLSTFYSPAFSGAPDGWGRLSKDLRGALTPQAREAPEKETREMSTQAPRETEATYEEPAYDRETGEVTRPAAPMAVRPEPQAPMARPEGVAPLRPAAPANPGPRTSDATDEIFRALADAQIEFATVEKTRTARIVKGQTSYTYKFANLSDVMKAIGPAMRKHSLVPVQIPMGNRVYVRLVHGPSGQWIEGVLPLVLPDHGADIQRLGSALTYLRRYLLTMLLGIVAEDESEDDDGASAQGQRGPRAA